MVQDKAVQVVEQAVESVDEITSPPVEKTKRRTGMGEEDGSPKKSTTAENEKGDLNLTRTTYKTRYGRDEVSSGIYD